MFNARAILRMSKVRTCLPGDDHLWNALTAQEWNLLRLADPSSLIGPFFPTLFDNFVASEDDAPVRKLDNLSHIRVLITSCGRVSWFWKAC